MSVIPYLVAYSLPAAWFVGVALGGPWVLLPIAVAFGLIPTLDPFLGHDTHDRPEEAQTAAFDGVLRAWVPVQALMLVTGLLAVATESVTGWEVAALALSTGIVTGGGGITVAHELMHRRESLDRGLAEVLMTMVSYTPFCVEHVLGHHKNVSTPLDPATSRLGESLYAYWPRAILGGLRSAWRIETARVRKRRLSGLADRRVRHAAMLAGAWIGVAVVGGWVGLAWFIGQSVVAILLLENVNYVEHYGLERAEIAPGKYERIQPHHSWNSTHRLTNWLLFNLPRHADHHAWAYRKYAELRAWPGAPAMPWGYTTMVLVALVPPLWFRVMDPRVAAARAEAKAA
jgi:alkane 1-monooxygenase